MTVGSRLILVGDPAQLPGTDPIGYHTNYTYNTDNYFLNEVSAQSSAGTLSVSYEYDGVDQLAKITHNGSDYIFGYDGFGNTVNIKVGSINLITHVYENGNGNLRYSVYGNNFGMDYGYDEYNRIISVQKNNALAYRNDYDARGNLARVTDTTEVPQKITEFFYDLGDRLVRTTFGEDSEIRQGYDTMDRIVSKYYQFANQARLAAFSYNVDNRKQKTSLLSGGEMTFRYDTLNRLPVTDLVPTAGVDLALRTQVDFVNLSGNRTTTLTDTYSNREKIGDSNTVLSSYEYTYDNNGNIRTITDAGNLTTYSYDQLNQLVRVDDQKAGVSATYAYDTGGNLISITTYDYTTGVLGTPVETISYSYDDDNWKDLLTNYNGEFITYDRIGNPLTYRDGMSFTWAGRQLTAATVNGETSSYTYNQDGIRIGKTVNGTTTDFLVDGSTIVAQRTDYSTMWFLYDSDGARVGFTYHDDAYYYLKNAQGDVTGIVDSNLNVVVEYSYDAWGKLISTTGSEANFIGKFNPFLYRGYYFDAETGLYYVGSRYYDPMTCRMINADSQLNNDASMIGSNLYVYCYNSPVNAVDNLGTQPQWSKAITGVAKNTLGYKVLLFVTKNGLLSNTFYAAGFVRDSKGVYHARQDALQQYGGYNDFYDYMFDLGTDMRNAKFEFSHNRKQYIFWAWKGDYLNLGAGAELGIYYGGGPLWLVDKSLAMPMSLTLKYKGRTIISYSANTWWITGFNPEEQDAIASKLTAIFIINFSGNLSMYNSFKRAWRNTSGWSFKINQATLIF